MTELNMSFAPIEGRHLLGIVDEFIALLDGPRDDADPALDRLSPAAYPDDAEASAEFRRSTRDDGFDQRLADALEVRTRLDRFEERGDTDLDDATDPNDTGETLSIGSETLDSWLRTLSGIRLVLASRLGIERTDAHDPEDLRFGTYDWLGYRLELLVQLADEHEAR
jgi:hypothetical protein